MENKKATLTGGFDLFEKSAQAFAAGFDFALAFTATFFRLR
jgi:hypothetical protein